MVGLEDEDITAFQGMSDLGRRSPQVRGHAQPESGFQIRQGYRHRISSVVDRKERIDLNRADPEGIARPVASQFLRSREEAGASFTCGVRHVEGRSESPGENTRTASVVAVIVGDDHPGNGFRMRSDRAEASLEVFCTKTCVNKDLSLIGHNQDGVALAAASEN